MRHNECVTLRMPKNFIDKIATRSKFNAFDTTCWSQDEDKKVYGDANEVDTKWNLSTQ